jgi:hypothetical protein
MDALVQGGELAAVLHGQLEEVQIGEVFGGG